MATFWLKKFISFWLMPLPGCLTLLVVGSVLLGSVRRARLGRRLVVLGTLLLAAFGNKTVSVWLVRPVEQRYDAIPELPPGQPLPPGLAAIRYVVVLGGGHSNVPDEAATTKLSSSGLARLVEAVRLLRRLPGAGLIVSGPATPGNPSHASVLAQAAASLGIARDRIQLIEDAHDTEDESRAVRARVGTAPIALVTSAWHMPRAAGLFRQAGMTVLPCPVDFTGRPSPEFSWSDLTWDSESLIRSTYAVREDIGYLWVWLRGKV